MPLCARRSLLCDIRSSNWLSSGPIRFSTSDACNHAAKQSAQQSAAKCSTAQWRGVYASMRVHISVCASTSMRASTCGRACAFVRLNV